jgi:adenylate cyclase
MADIRINRKLAAILAADVVGYSRLMGADEAGTLAALKQHRETIFDPAVAAHNGRIVRLIGDGVIAEFGSRGSWDSTPVARDREDNSRKHRAERSSRR